jgi:hypothetical protein
MPPGESGPGPLGGGGSGGASVSGATGGRSEPPGRVEAAALQSRGFE